MHGEHGVCLEPDEGRNLWPHFLQRGGATACRRIGWLTLLGWRVVQPTRWVRPRIVGRKQRGGELFGKCSMQDSRSCEGGAKRNRLVYDALDRDARFGLDGAQGRPAVVKLPVASRAAPRVPSAHLRPTSHSGDRGVLFVFVLRRSTVAILRVLAAAIVGHRAAFPVQRPSRPLVRTHHR